MDDNTMRVQRRRYLGLKWKTFLYLSAVMLLVNASLAALVYHKTTSQFEIQQAEKRLALAREFRVVLAKSVESITALAALIPGLHLSTGKSPGVAPADQMLAGLSRQGLLLDLEWGIEGVHYFRPEALEGAVASWPQGRRVPALAGLLELADTDEEPKGRIICRLSCSLVVAVPLLEGGSTAGFLVVERAIGDTLREFHMLSGTDIVILERDESGPTATSTRTLPGWERRVLAITREALTLPVLRALSEQAALRELLLSPQRIRLAADWYELHALAMDTAWADHPLLLIDRVTGQVHAIREATSDSILLGLLGLLVSEILLLALLWAPMQRIQHAVSTLPLLVDKSYARLRRELPGLPADGVMRDEIDEMIAAIARISREIEILDCANAVNEHALRDSEQALQMAQSLARVTSWVGHPIDGYFRFGAGAVQIHPALEQVTTWTGFLALVHPDDRSHLRIAWRQRHGGSLDVEFRLLIGGCRIHMHALAGFETVGAQRILRATGMMQDVSETRAIQRSLHDQRSVLEREVEERMAQYVEARDAAERALQAKSRFLADMSHEIRTPLHAILGLSQVGMQHSRNRRIGLTFEQILEAGQHLLKVVNDILEISRFEAGGLLIHAQAFDLRNTLRQSTDMLQRQMTLKSLQMVVVVDDDVPDRLTGDAFRLQQILLNLLGNAVKFTERGTVSLHVSRDATDVLFKVSDTGIGMPADQIKRIFLPYQQATAGSRAEERGIGLGLSISHTLASHMGGEIAVQSRPGAGSDFVLRLPLGVADAPAEVLATPPVEVGTPRLPGVRVLVVDDVHLNRSVIESLLQGEGVHVVAAPDGQQACDLLLQKDAQAFDLVLMDIEMPTLDGRAATRRIRAAGLTLPIVGVTAHVSPSERAASIGAGMDEQLVKPVMLDALVDVIGRLTRREGPPDYASRS